MAPRHYRKVETVQDIRKTARAAAAALESVGLKCYLFGSAACSMYGMCNRLPNDVDIVVSARNLDTETIKERVVDADDDFYLVDSTNPRATYRILWYAIPNGSRAHCKVDILIPGQSKSELRIPRIPIDEITYTNVPGVPVMPMLPLLLLKLQGWTDHRDSNQQRMQDKVPADEDDIRELLSLCAMPSCSWGVTLQDDGEDWLPEWFLQEAQSRVEEFVDEFRNTAKRWRRIGFDV